MALEGQAAAAVLAVAEACERVARNAAGCQDPNNETVYTMRDLARELREAAEKEVMPDAAAGRCKPIGGGPKHVTPAGADVESAPADEPPMPERGPDRDEANAAVVHRLTNWDALHTYAEWAKRRIDELERIMKAKDELESARRHHYTARAEKAEARVAELEQQAEADAQAEAEGSNEPLSAMMAEEAIAEARFDSAMRDEARLDPHLSTDATEAELRGTIATLERMIESQRSALTKISAIRDSIVGMQGFNWSEHAYPLVAVLGEVGFPGAGYEIARENLGTLIEQVKQAEGTVTEMREAAAALMLEVTRWRELAEKATPGPWKINRYDNEGGEINWQVQQDRPPAEVLCNISDECGRHMSARHDAAFIAASREAVPRLCEIVERLAKP